MEDLNMPQPLYYVNDKVFSEKCDAREWSYQLCREFAKDNSRWKVINIKGKTDNVIDSYAVWSLDDKQVVYDAIIVVEY